MLKISHFINKHKNICTFHISTSGPLFSAETEKFTVYGAKSEVKKVAFSAPPCQQALIFCLRDKS